MQSPDGKAREWRTERSVPGIVKNSLGVSLSLWKWNFQSLGRDKSFWLQIADIHLQTREELYQCGIQMSVGYTCTRQRERVNRTDRKGTLFLRHACLETVLMENFLQGLGRFHLNNKRTWKPFKSNAPFLSQIHLL